MKNIKKKIISFLKNAKWYHTIDVPGFGKTNGVYDHNYVIKYYKFGNLKNKTCIDVGCSNGFFSFLLKKVVQKKLLQ